MQSFSYDSHPVRRNLSGGTEDIRRSVYSARVNLNKPWGWEGQEDWYKVGLD